MAVPVLIFLVCLLGGTVASARWLPDLPHGTIAGLAFFVVCGLLGAALSMIGLHVYSIAHELEHSGGPFSEDGEIFALGVRSMLLEAGTLAGLAAILYLLAYKHDATRLRTHTSGATVAED
jgi:hypothetical protein